MRLIYKLDADRNPVPMGTSHAEMIEWARWCDIEENRRVGDTVIGWNGEHVSTIFTGIDLRLFEGKPVLFETRVFGGPLDGHTWRYATWNDAETGHAEAVKICQTVIKREP